MMQTVHFITLGCPSNGVDSASVQHTLMTAGLTGVSTPEQADVIVVNTCGLTEADQQLGIDQILAAGELRAQGRCQVLVVAGCLSQGYAPQLQQALPEVDHFLGTGNLHTLPRLLGLSATPPKRVSRFSLPVLPARKRVRPAVLQVDINLAQGCSSPCTFCAVPTLRGPMRPVSVSTIAALVRQAVQAGAKEINLYAHDLGVWETLGGPSDTLPALIQTLDHIACAAPSPVWFRLQHAHPASVSDAFITALADSTSVLPYVDLPIQHIQDAILIPMGRKIGETATRDVVAKLRARVPHLTLRSTLLTGLPNETEADFAALVALVESQLFDHLSIAAYSPQEGTQAAAMAQTVSPAVAQNRCDQLRALHADLLLDRQQARVGEVVTVLVEGMSAESDLLLQGRHRGQRPRDDGLTYITQGTASPGDFVSVRIDEVHDQDLAGAMVDIAPTHTPSSAYDSVALPRTNVLGAHST
jgi:ribosomal protein S12 methylthiotransferase